MAKIHKAMFVPWSPDRMWFMRGSYNIYNGACGQWVDGLAKPHWKGVTCKQCLAMRSRTQCE